MYCRLGRQLSFLWPRGRWCSMRIQNYSCLWAWICCDRLFTDIVITKHLPLLCHTHFGNDYGSLLKFVFPLTWRHCLPDRKLVKTWALPHCCIPQFQIYWRVWLEENWMWICSVPRYSLLTLRKTWFTSIFTGSLAQHLPSCCAWFSDHLPSSTSSYTDNCVGVANVMQISQHRPSSDLHWFSLLRCGSTTSMICDGNGCYKLTGSEKGNSYTNLTLKPPIHPAPQ